MDTEFIVLCAAVLGASTLQAATGIGFGIIAGPVLLVVMNDATAIQVSVVLNLLIALLLAPALYRLADRRVLMSLALGVLLGSPLGLLIYMNLDLAALKVLAGLAVLFTLVMLMRRRGAEVPGQYPVQPGRSERVVVGIIAGTMGGSLAMPGPVPAAWMAARHFEKERVRATVLLMFVVAYTVALVLQHALVGLAKSTLVESAMLAPAVVAGVILGHVSSKRITERTFRVLLMAVLAATVALLLLTTDA